MNRNTIAGIIILGLIATIGVIMLISISNPPGSLHFRITFDDANDLKAGDAIYYKGVAIGEVRAVDIQNDDVITFVTIKSDFKEEIPIDSYFFIWMDKVVTNKKCIRMEKGDSQKIIKNGDQLNGESSYTKIGIFFTKKYSKKGFEYLESWWEETKTELDDKLKEFKKNNSPD